MFVHNFKYLASIDNNQKRPEARTLRYVEFQIELCWECAVDWNLLSSAIKYDANQESAVSRTPNADLSLSDKIPWSMVSKAALKTNRTSKVTCCLFLFKKSNFLLSREPIPCCVIYHMMIVAWEINYSCWCDAEVVWLAHSWVSLETNFELYTDRSIVFEDWVVRHLS